MTFRAFALEASLLSLIGFHDEDQNINEQI